MPGMPEALREARDLLLVANRDNPKALGDLGYVVDDSPQRHKVIVEPVSAVA
jgi:hypothetical protein